MLLCCAGVSQANAQAVAQAVFEALTCDCACEQPTAVALAQAAAKAEGGCGGVAQSLAGKRSTRKVLLSTPAGMGADSTSTLAVLAWKDTEQSCRQLIHAGMCPAVPGQKHASTVLPC